jgi:PAS domain S-box-containing protein
MMNSESMRAENAELQARLEQAEETIRAIQQGGVDAFVLQELASYRVHTLDTADRPYRVFVEEMQQGVATLHADGTILYCNRRLPDLLKQPHEKVVGAKLRDFIVATDLPEYENLLWQGQTRSGRGEARLRRADGGYVPAYLTFNALPTDNGVSIGVFVTDLTAQKHHEQLLAAQEALREADRRKSEFLAVLAHELRNPLAPIRNAVNILRMKGDDPATVRSTTGMLERQVAQIVRLVEDLLDVSRISRNLLELRKEPVELAAILNQAIESIRPQCESMEHELALAVPTYAIFVEGDAARLTQVFTNLLDNACKYMAKRGRLRLAVEVSREREPGEVTVRVSDSGIGIAPDQVDRIFDMFTQADSSVQPSRCGLGIGLTLVKHLVEAHAGQIEAQSKGLGEGSEFIVRLPILPESAKAAGRETGGVAATPNYRILVADDNQDSADSLATLLKLDGHETRTTFDGAEAVQAAEAFQPHVVLLDIAMPKINGYDACRKIRSQPWGKGMTLIAQTGWDQNDDKRRIQEAGFDAHLMKPVDHAALMNILASLRDPSRSPAGKA